MSERYFLGLLVVLSAAGAVWVSSNPEVIPTQIWVSVLVALFGLVALANLRSTPQSSVILPLYFITALAFSLYVYLTRPIGVILSSAALLSLVGLVLSFGMPSAGRREARKAAAQPAGTASKKAAKKKIAKKQKAPRKKSAKKKR